ncbi:MAG: glycosyltransferase [Novosphingobium sp.]|nr:glycosyltransferase [Novosphingobium sp.]
MKVSVVTAVWNRETTVGGAIDSVAAQTYPTIEHLVIDGASTDGTLAQVEARRRPGMVVISERDAGIYDALNKGLAASTGDVVGLLHSDDFFAHARVIERVAALFADPAVDAVYGDLDYVSASDTTRIIRHWRAGEATRARLARGWMPPHPTLFVRRHVFETHGAYDTRYRIAADYDAVLRWFGRAGITSAYLPEVLVKMRVGGESNASIRKILRKSREDYRALRTNRIGGIGTLIAKNLSKLPQFFG